MGVQVCLCWLYMLLLAAQAGVKVPILTEHPVEKENEEDIILCC